MWWVCVFLICLLKANGQDNIDSFVHTDLESLKTFFEINMKGIITPCLVSILNATMVSMVCSSEPSTLEVRQYIYQHVCRPQDVRAIRIKCYPYFKMHDYPDLIHAIHMKKSKHKHLCWCGHVHFDNKHMSTFYNIETITPQTCDITQANLHNILPHSLELYGVMVHNLDYGRLQQASIIVLHDSLTSPPSLLDLVGLRSLQLLSLKSHNYSSLLDQWQLERRFIQSYYTNQSSIIEVSDLEISGSNVVEIPERLFTILKVKVALSLCANAIQTISVDTFRGLTTLRALHLKSNNISYIHKDAFKTLTNLNWIDLHDNQIQTLDTNLFFNMNSGLPFVSSGVIPGH